MNEEYSDEESSRPSVCPNRAGGGHSMTSTNFTTTTTNLTAMSTDEDNAQLLKPKKKKGLFKNLFHFSSKKGRSKSTSSDPNEEKKRNETSVSVGSCVSKMNDSGSFSPDAAKQYQIEQEKINIQYRKLLEQNKYSNQPNQQFSGPPNGVMMRNQLRPMHQSMPISVAHRTKSSLNSKNELVVLNSPNGYQPGLPSNYGSHINRDTVGVPHKDRIMAYMRNNHRVYPQANPCPDQPMIDKLNEPNSQVSGHERIISKLLHYFVF